MAKTIIENSSVTGLKQTVASDGIDDHGRLVFVTEQDLEPTLKNIARRREEKHDPDFKPAAEIPGVIVEQLMRDGTFNDPERLKRWLNDPQNECFRIWKGRV